MRFILALWLAFICTLQPALADIFLAIPGEAINAGDSIILTNGIAFKAGLGQPIGVAVQSGTPQHGAIQISLSSNIAGVTGPVAVSQSGTWQVQLLQPALTNAHIFVGNASNIATDVAVSGDATMANTGALTLVNTTVTPGSYLLAGITVDSKGRLTAASSASLASSDIWVGNGSNVPTAVSMSGDATLANTGALTLANTAVTPGSYTSTNLTVNSKGLITAASSGSGGTFLGWSGDMSKRHGWLQTLANSTNYTVTQAVGSNVANSYLELVNRSGQELTTGGATGNSAYLQDGQSPNVFTIEEKPVITFSVTPVSTTNLRWWFGCFTPTAQDGDGLAANGVTGFGIRDSTTAGDTNYKFCTSDGAADTVIDTGIAITANTPVVFVFDTSPGSKIDCYANGTKVASSSTHLPPNTTALDWILRMFTEENAAKSYWVGRVYWEAY